MLADRVGRRAIVQETLPIYSVFTGLSGEDSSPVGLVVVGPPGHHSTLPAS